jgi:hypothetical protein
MAKDKNTPASLEDAGVNKEVETVVEETAVSEGLSDLVLIRFLLSPTGKFGLGYSAGEEGEFEEKQATELVEAKYAEYVK